MVTELIQKDCNTKKIKKELEKILETTHRNKLLTNYAILEKKLGGEGASCKTAQLIVNNMLSINK